MKYEWKKNEKSLYGVKQVPEIIEVPNENYIMISGEGNPNEVDFANRVGALYSMGYGIKMLFKKSINDEKEIEYNDFTVFPLTGIWEQKGTGDFDKNNLKYTIMIKQPNFITKQIFDLALENVKHKKPNKLYDEIVFECIENEKVVQILHVGSFDNEENSFDKMNRFMDKNGFSRKNIFHIEIYLNNKNRTSEENLKTILRYNVK